MQGGGAPVGNGRATEGAGGVRDLRRRNFPSGRVRGTVALAGLTLLWAAALADACLWLLRLSDTYSAEANLASHLWPYLSMGGALAGLLARGAPNALRSVPTLWLLASLALLFGSQLVPRDPLPPPSSPVLRVLTLNLGEFPENHPRALSFLKERRSVDLVFLQEVHGDASRGDRLKLEAALGARLRHAAWGAGPEGTGEIFGLGIMSRYPLHRVGAVKLPSGGAPGFCRELSALTAGLRFAGRTIRLATVHLCPPAVPWRSRSGRRIPVSLSSVSDWVSDLRPFESARRSQLRFLRRMADGGAVPFLLAGDLNTTAHSLDFRGMSGSLTDAFAERGMGFGFTYSVGFFGARIDHVLHSREITAREAIVHDVKVSDHRPLEAVLEIPPPKAP